MFCDSELFFYILTSLVIGATNDPIPEKDRSNATCQPGERRLHNAKLRVQMKAISLVSLSNAARNKGKGNITIASKGLVDVYACCLCSYSVFATTSMLHMAPDLLIASWAGIGSRT